MQPFARFMAIATLAIASASPVAAQTTTLRGAMVGDRPSAATLTDLRNYGANVVRVQIHSWALATPPAAHEVPAYIQRYHQWITDEIASFRDVVLPTAHRIGLRVCIDLHLTPGGRNPATNRDLIFEAGWARGLYLTTVRRIAGEVGSHPAVWAFDLANEPAGTINQWRNLAAEAAVAARSVAPGLRLVIESPYGSITRLVDMEPLPIDRCVYSFHFYSPMKFTHQGINGQPEGFSFPGVYRNIWSPYQEMRWDADTITEMVRPAAQWAQRHGVRIFVGEFSCRADRAGRNEYMSGCIQAFERFGFQWTYHAFREAQVWNHEGGAAWRTIRQAFARN